MKKSLRLTETAVMLSLAFILSLLKIMDMPFGGSVTACSMLPTAVIAYRHKTPWGLFTGFVYGLLQMLMGIKNLTYATSPLAAAAIIILDYLAAFMFLGIAGIFRGIIKDRGVALAAGTLLACLMRYACHVVSGCTVWMGVSIPDTDGLIFSAAYNAAYMVPESVITVVGAYFIGSLLSITELQVKRLPLENGRTWSIASSVPAAVGTVTAFVMVFGMMQTEDGFDITAVGGREIYDWIGIIVILAVSAAATAAIKALHSRRKRKTA